MERVLKSFRQLLLLIAGTGALQMALVTADIHVSFACSATAANFSEDNTECSPANTRDSNVGPVLSSVAPEDSPTKLKDCGASALGLARATRDNHCCQRTFAEPDRNDKSVYLITRRLRI